MNAKKGEKLVIVRLYDKNVEKGDAGSIYLIVVPEKYASEFVIAEENIANAITEAKLNWKKAHPQTYDDLMETVVKKLKGRFPDHELVERYV